MDDNKDLGALEEPEGFNFKGNYRSNEGGKASNLAVQNDDPDFGREIDADLNKLGELGPEAGAGADTDQNALDYDLNIDLNSDSDEDGAPFGELPLDFDSEDMLAQIKQVVQEETTAGAKSEFN